MLLLLEMTAGILGFIFKDWVGLRIGVQFCEKSIFDIEIIPRLNNKLQVGSKPSLFIIEMIPISRT